MFEMKIPSIFTIIAATGLLLLSACSSGIAEPVDPVYQQALACATTQICLSPEIVNGVNVYPEGAEMSYDSVPGYAAYVVLDTGPVENCPDNVHEYAVINIVIPPYYENGTNDLPYEAGGLNGSIPAAPDGATIIPWQVVAVIRTRDVISPIGPLLVTTSGFKAGTDAFGGVWGGAFWFHMEEVDKFDWWSAANEQPGDFSVPDQVTTCQGANVVSGARPYGNLPVNP